jgi:hypothetical protein
MRPTSVGSIDHGSDENAAMVALSAAADGPALPPVNLESRVNVVVRRLSAVAA